MHRLEHERSAFAGDVDHRRENVRHLRERMDDGARRRRAEDRRSLPVRSLVRGKFRSTSFACRSMDGEGNFNWRFVYQFHYFPAEKSISVKKKEHFWSYDTTEYLIPPVLNLQIWDNDKFSLR